MFINLKGRFFAVVALALCCLPPVSCAQELTADEAWAVKNCEDNATSGKMSPDVAAQCVDLLSGGFADKLYAVDKHKADTVLWQSYALKDLGDLCGRLKPVPLPDTKKELAAFVFGMPNFESARSGIIKKFRSHFGPDDYTRVISSLGLNIADGSLLAWVKHYYPAGAPTMAMALMEWDALTPELRAAIVRMKSMLSDYSSFELCRSRFPDLTPELYDKVKTGEWSRLTLSERSEVIDNAISALLVPDWKRRLEAPDADAAAIRKELVQTGKFANFYLRAGVSLMIDKTFGPAARNYVPGAAPPDGVCDKKFYLYDGSVVCMSNKEYSAIFRNLEWALRREIAGTATGKKILDFYDAEDPATGNKIHQLKLAMSDDAGALASYNPETGYINFGLNIAAAALKSRHFTLHDLQARSAALSFYARRIGPVFVHEATHQMQHAAVSDYKYIQDMETESFSRQCVFILEKMEQRSAYRALRGLRNSTYVRDIEPENFIHLKAFLVWGTNGIMENLMPHYPEVDTLDSMSAAQYKGALEADFIRIELAARDKLKSENPQAEQALDSERVREVGQLPDGEPLSKLSTSALEKALAALQSASRDAGPDMLKKRTQFEGEVLYKRYLFLKKMAR